MSEENKTEAELKRLAAPAPVIVAAAAIVQNRGELSEAEIERQIKMFGE